MLKRIETIAIVIALTTLSGHAQLPFSEDFETGQTVGQQPTGASNVRPSVNTATYFTKVVDTANTAGSGNGVQMLDNDVTPSIGNTVLEYNFVPSVAAGQSLIRAEFAVAYKGGQLSGTNYMTVGFGEYNPAVTVNANATRWCDLRLYDDGSVTPGTASLLPSNSSHTVTMFINDLPDKVYYIGPDATTNGLNADSIAYWIDGSLTAASSLDVDDLNSGGQTIGTTTNNFGKFGISSPSDREGLNFVFDDISIDTFDTIYVPPEIVPDGVILSVTYEDDIVGNQPIVDTPATLIRPAVNTPDYFVKVVSQAENVAGSGNGVRIYDNSATSAGICGLEYNIVDAVSNQISAVRIDFDFAYVSTNASFNKPIHFGVSEYAPTRTMGSSRQRWSDMRFYADGTVDFRRNAPPGTDTNDVSYNVMSTFPQSQNNIISNDYNSVSIFVNDYETQYVDYTGPDGEVYTLPTNSAAYWLNGDLVMMMDDDETNAYITLDLFDYATARLQFDQIAGTEDNIGKIGFVSESTGGFNNDWVFDNILVSTQLLFVVDSYEKWLSLYPGVGVQTNYTDDVEPDGMDNLMEFALGADPTTNDTALFMPTYHVTDDGGIKYLNYVYNRRDNAVDCDLTYSVNAGADLALGLPSPTQELAPVGAGEQQGFEIVTNRIPTSASPAGFMQLEIEITD